MQNEKGFQKVTCQLRKTLVDVPLNAGGAMKGVKGKFVTEQWTGVADIDSRAFCLDAIGAWETAAPRFRPR